jgi:hypothetical protein
MSPPPPGAAMGMLPPGPPVSPPPGAGGPHMIPPPGAGDPHVMPPPPFIAPCGGDCPEEAPPALQDEGCNAFKDDCNNCGYHCQLNLGFMGLIRQPLSSGKLGFLDPGINVGGTQLFADTGFLPPAGTPAILDYHDVSQEMHFGYRAGLMVRQENYCFELAGFYIPQQTQTTVRQVPSQLDLAFGFFNNPIGFTSNNNLFLQADQAKLAFQNTIASVEANFRVQMSNCFEWIIGARAIDYQERFMVFVDDDSITTGVFDPTLTALYTTRTHTRLVGPQLGFQAEWGLCSCIAFGGFAKGMWGPNFEATDVLLRRGDFFYGPSAHVSQTIFSHAYEVGLFADFLISPQFKIRAGYEGLFLVDVPEAVQQVNFDLGNPTGHLNNHGSIFFHGPIFEVQFVF